MGRPGSSCAVAVCPSPKGAAYHRFPNNLSLKRIWIEACKRKDPFNVESGNVLF